MSYWMRLRELLRYVPQAQLVVAAATVLLLFVQTGVVVSRLPDGPAGTRLVGEGPDGRPVSQIDPETGELIPVPEAAAVPGAAGRPGTTAQSATRSGGESRSTGASQDTGAGGSTTEVGVSDTEIHMGFVTSPCGDSGASQAGFDTLSGDCRRDQRIVRAFLDEYNKGAGIHGRKIVPYFREVDPFSDDSMRAMCTYFAKQVKVMAVVSHVGPFGDPILCLTRDNRIPYLQWDAEPDEWYQQSRHDGFPYYMTTGISKSRTMRQWVEWGVAHAWFPTEDAFGVLSTEYPGDKIPIDNALKPQLRKRGIKIKEEVRFAQADNLELLSTQMAGGVQAMKRAEVTHIYMGVNLVYATLFMQAAEQQDYYPEYSFNDFASISTEFAADFFPPRSWDGVTGITSYLTGDPRVDERHERLSPHARCEQFVQERTGENLEQAPIALLWCQNLRGMELALRGAGRSLTRNAYTHAMASIGSMNDFMNTSDGGSWTMDKLDAPVNVATIRWDANCPVRPYQSGDRPGCYRQIEPFRPFYPE